MEAFRTAHREHRELTDRRKQQEQELAEKKEMGHFVARCLG
jgi:hypothetical protein